MLFFNLGSCSKAYRSYTEVIQAGDPFGPLVDLPSVFQSVLVHSTKGMLVRQYSKFMIFIIDPRSLFSQGLVIFFIS